MKTPSGEEIHCIIDWWDDDYMVPASYVVEHPEGFEAMGFNAHWDQNLAGDIPNGKRGNPTHLG